MKLKKLLPTTAAIIALSVSVPAVAKSAKDIGVIFGKAEMCKLSGRINKPTFGIIKLKIAAKYDLGNKPKWFTNNITKAQMKEMDRQGKKEKEWTKDITCNALHDEWLK